MKKLLSIIVAISITCGSFAQMGKVTSALSFIEQGLLDKAKEALDQALVNEKSKDNPKTWVAKGKLAQECFRSENPKFKAFYKDPLKEAMEAYEKALELDQKGSVEKQLKLSNTYVLLGNDFITQGVQRFEAQDFAGALQSFESNIKLASSDLYIGVADTGIFFNAGLAAYNGKMFDKAIPYFQKCADLKYEGPMPYFLIYNSYKEMKDMAKAEATLIKTFEQYPDNQDVILNLIDFYMSNDKLSEAFSYLNMAKSKDPNNYTLFWAEGVLYMKQEKYDEAIASLKKSIELKADEYNTQFNLGVCFYNKAVAMFQKANEIMDVPQYNAAINEANGVFIQAIPYFETAATLKKDDPDSLRNLKELYFRLRTVKPEFQAKYDEVVKKLENM
ncbi:MAG: tetratricopeptide repeat protein [Bacteroidales bacterium]|nr:tetratricopeptide repeat protein [Bacteroidales bacterium]